MKTDGSGAYSFAKTPADGYHGSVSLIKVLPHAFVMNDDYSRAPMAIEDDTANTLGIRLPATSAEAYAFVVIPVGFKATHVQVYASASTSNAVDALSFNQTTGAQ